MSSAAQTSVQSGAEQHVCGRLLLHHQDDVIAGLEGGVKLNEVDMVELVHHLNLIPHHFL